MPVGRRKVLLAKLKTARGADVPSSGLPLPRSLSRLNSSGGDFDDDEPLAVFASPTPAYGAAVGGTRGLRLSLGEPPAGLPSSASFRSSLLFCRYFESLLTSSGIKSQACSAA